MMHNISKGTRKHSFCLLLFLGSFLFAQETPPNIILVLADDLGYGDLSCYGQSHFSTPNIDAIAASGARFTQHYAGSPVCAPSRAVLMTGLHTGHVRVRGNKQNPEGFGQLPLDNDEYTFVQSLQKAGYRTGGFGKWGLGNLNTTGSPFLKGFDTFFGYYDQILAHNSYPEYLYDNEKKVLLDNKVKYLSDNLWHRGLGSYSTEKKVFAHDVIFDEALQFIDEDKEEPFFLYYATTIPHDNGEAPVGQRIEVPDAAKFKNELWEEEEKCYAALVEYLDTQMGQLVQHLKNKGVWENTIIVFTSDHGAISFPNLENNRHLRGFKRDMYEGGLKVPFIVSWPSKIGPKQVLDHVSAFWDIGPTLLDMAEVEPLKSTDGISFLPVLTGKEQKEHEYLYWEFHFWKPSRYALRFGDWKAVKNHPTSTFEIYNLVKDPSESNNVALKFPEIVQKAEQFSKAASVPSKHFEPKN